MLQRQLYSGKQFVILKEKNLFSHVKLLAVIVFGVVAFIKFGFDNTMMPFSLIFYVATIWGVLYFIDLFRNKLVINNDGIKKQGLFVNISWSWNQIELVKIKLGSGRLINMTRSALADSEVAFVEKEILISNTVKDDFNFLDKFKSVVVVPFNDDLVEWLISNRHAQ